MKNMRLEYYIIVVSAFLVLSILAIIYSQPPTIPMFESRYDREELFEMHDVVVDVSREAVMKDPDKVVVRVNEFYKNPTDASHLTIWGDFAQNSDFCKNPRHDNTCSRFLAYLYKDKNGVYHQGEYFAFITEECDAKCHLGLKN